MANPRWIIASNRLPFAFDSERGELKESSGGLVTAISGIRGENPITWVGVAPEKIDAGKWAELSSSEKNNNKEYQPVFVEDALYDRYYNGMCNNVIWPLLHYESGLVRYSEAAWQAYVEVNRMFAKAIVDIAEENSLIWVHDFHLFLLPRLLKRRRKNLKVGFFLHTPFPSSEIFRQLPVRREILESVLSSDLVGFHDYGYLRHFCSAIYYVLGLETSMMSVEQHEHTTQLGVFPVSIDTKHFMQESKSSEVKRLYKRYRKEGQYQKLILGVDRLDYIKGIKLKLLAFKKLLSEYGETLGRVGLLQIAVPSRTNVPGYQALKDEVERLVGEINGEFGQPNFMPVHYMFSSVHFKDLLALYQLANVLLVTSKRDGMNLVALEYLAAQIQNNPGVVVLSEFTGANSTLSHALPTNPWDTDNTAHNIHLALTMDRHERTVRHRAMLDYLEGYTATDWAESFMKSLSRQIPGDSMGSAVALSPQKNGTFELAGLFAQHKNSSDNSENGGEQKRGVVVFLDYDGTLVPIKDTPEEAVMTDKERAVVTCLLETSDLELVLVSGRPRRFLSKQFEGLPISYAVEHGSRFYNAEKEKWTNLIRGEKTQWYGLAKSVMEDYSKRVPGSFVEKKQHSIVWHHRKSPVEFGNYQALKLKHDLENALQNLPVSVQSAKKIVEVRAIEANKGRFAKWYLALREDTQNPFIVTIGDDATDEDLFSVFEEENISIKVGPGRTSAKYRLAKQEDVTSVLGALAKLFH